MCNKTMAKYMDDITSCSEKVFRILFSHLSSLSYSYMYSIWSHISHNLSPVLLAEKKAIIIEKKLSISSSS
jgi:hypothetical protein